MVLHMGLWTCPPPPYRISFTPVPKETNLTHILRGGYCAVRYLATTWLVLLQSSVLMYVRTVLYMSFSVRSQPRFASVMALMALWYSTVCMGDTVP